MGFGSNLMFRTDQMGYTDMMEKRQLFLRSYQFSRKKSMAERIKGSFFRVKRVIGVRLRSATKLRKVVWLRIRSFGLFYSTRRRKFFFLRLHHHNHHCCGHGSSSSYCFFQELVTLLSFCCPICFLFVVLGRKYYWGRK